MGPGRSQSAVIPLSPHPSQAKTPWGASNGPLDHERAGPLGFTRAGTPGARSESGGDQIAPSPGPSPRGLNHQDPGGGAIEPMGTRPMAPPSKLPPPPLTAGRQGWSAASLFWCPVVLLPRAGRRRPGQGRPQGLEPSSTGGQGQGKVGAPGQASSPSRSSERP